MRGIILAEFHQTLRSYPKAIATVAAAVILLRLFTGSFGSLLILLILLPNIAVGIGVGTLSEEYTKGQLRYLYGMSVRPIQLWIVKLVSGVMGVFEFAALIGLLIWLVPPLVGNDTMDPLEALGIGLWGAVAVILAFSVFAYSAGLAAMSVCQSQRIASIVSTVLIYLPAVALLVVSAATQSMPSTVGIVIVAAVGALILLVGATVQFFLRNPFIDRPWQWAGTGAAIGGVAAVFTTMASVFVSLALPGKAIDLGWDRGIASHLASPDGQHAIVVRVGPGGTSGEVRDADGEHRFELQPRAMVLYGDSGPLTFSPGFDRVVYQTVTEPVDDKVEFRLHVLDLQSGEEQTFDSLSNRDDHADSIRILRWSDDGRYLYALSQNWKTDTVEVLRQAIPGGTVEHLDIEGDVPPQVLSDGRVVLTHWDAEGVPTRVELMSWPDGEAREVTLPAETENVAIHPAGGSAVLVRKPVDGTGARYLVETFNLDSAEQRVILGQPTLPEASLADAVKGRLGYVSAWFSPEGRWVLVNVNRTATRQTWLVDPDTAEARLLRETTGEDYSYTTQVFSPDESRVFMLIDHGEVTIDDQQLRTQRLLVLDLEDPDAPPLFDGVAELYGNDYQWFGENRLLYQLSQADRPDRDIRVIDLDTGEDRLFLSDDAADPAGMASY